MNNKIIMFFYMRNSFLLLILCCLLSGCGSKDRSAEGSESKASNFPNRPINLYVGFQAGGGTDITARAVASRASECLGQPVNVVNMPGASSVLAANKVASSQPDGYNLLVAGGSETVSVGHFKELPHHPINDFSPIIRLTVEKIVLSVDAEAPYKTLDEFVSAAKKNPGKFKYSSSGQFGIFHAAALVFSKEAGIEMNHVPYSGGAPSVAALMGEHIDLSITSPVSVASLNESGQVNSLAQSSPEERSPLIPNVPTLNELGYDINIVNQKGLVAPADTPKERINFLHDCFKKVLVNPEFIDVAEKVQLEVAYLGSEEFQASLQSIYDEIGSMLN